MSAERPRRDAGEGPAGARPRPGSDPRDAIERRQRFLVNASALLSSSLDYQETLDLVAALVVPEIADWCSIELLEDGEIRNVAVHHADPRKVELARRLRREYRTDPESSTGIPAVIRTGRSEFHARIPDSLLVAAARDERHLAIMRDLELSSAIVAPLTARGQTIGTLALIGERGRHFDDDDLVFAEEVARRAAVAVDNARLYETQVRALADAEEAHARLERLQAVTEALSETVTRTDVANVLVREGLVALRAQAGAIFTLGSDRRRFERLASAGRPDEIRSRWSSFDAGVDGPAATAVRTGELVVVESRAELLARWPGHAASDQPAIGEASLTAPLLLGDEAAGVLHLAFRLARTFDATDRAFVTTLARQCAQSLERARVYEREQGARAYAERLADRLRRLQSVIDATFFTRGSLDQLLRGLLARLREAVGSDTATILVLNDTEDALVGLESIGFDEPTETRVPVGRGFAGTIAATRKHLVIADVPRAEVVSSYLRTARIASLAGVPLIADGQLVGVVHVGSKLRREFDDEDLLLLQLVAGRAAVAILRAREHEREHRIAEILQRSLLPERLPAIEDVEVAARYVPGAAGVAVGGDWYDVFELPGGSIGVAVGDVVGHGVRAAAAMGRLRHVLRAYAFEGYGPAETLSRVNRLACETVEESFGTIVHALIDPTRTKVRLASAGHPPVLVRSRDGTVTTIEGGRSVPVGATADADYTEVELRLAAGSTLVLYTDGLVERRGESIDTGIGRLIRLVADAGGALDELADTVIAGLEDAAHSDDVVLLVVQPTPVPVPRLSLRFPAEPDALAPVRADLRSWLQAHGVGDDDAFDLLVAVNEACTNAVEHPLDRLQREVTLEAELAGEDVSIVIWNPGRWRPETPGSDRGRGLAFMRALTDDLEVQRSESGTSVVLRRRLRRANGDDA